MHKNKRENNTSILMLQVKEIEGLIQYLKSLRTNLIHWYKLEEEQTYSLINKCVVR